MLHSLLLVSTALAVSTLHSMHQVLAAWDALPSFPSLKIQCGVQTVNTLDPRTEHSINNDGAKLSVKYSFT